MTSVANELRTTYNSGRTRPLAWRKHQLEQMVKMLEENESAFLDALAVDLGKPRVEGFITDIAFVTSEVKSMIKNLKKWNKPERVSTPIVAMPGKSRLIPERLALFSSSPHGIIRSISYWSQSLVRLLPATPS